MKRYLLATALMVCISLGLFTTTAQAEQPTAEQARDLVMSLHKRAAAVKYGAGGQIDAYNAVIREHVDFRYLAGASLGRQASGFTSDERREYLDLFSEAYTYRIGDFLRDYLDRAKLTWANDSHNTARGVTVGSRVHRRGEDIIVAWKVTLVNGTPRIYNYVVEGLDLAQETKLATANYMRSYDDYGKPNFDPEKSVFENLADSLRAEIAARRSAHNTP